MHQQQQNIIHAISYDNAQSTKIERPAPLSLHLKLHWNYNQQLLQGKGRENKGREMLKKKIKYNNSNKHRKAFSMLLRKACSSLFLAPWTHAPGWSQEPGFAEHWWLKFKNNYLLLARAGQSHHFRSWNFPDNQTKHKVKMSILLFFPGVTSPLGCRNRGYLVWARRTRKV